jgi:hypothetical protein
MKLDLFIYRAYKLSGVRVLSLPHKQTHKEMHNREARSSTRGNGAQLSAVEATCVLGEHLAFGIQQEKTRYLLWRYAW